MKRWLVDAYLPDDIDLFTTAETAAVVSFDVGKRHMSCFDVEFS